MSIFIENIDVSCMKSTSEFLCILTHCLRYFDHRNRYLTNIFITVVQQVIFTENLSKELFLHLPHWFCMQKTRDYTSYLILLIALLHFVIFACCTCSLAQAYFLREQQNFGQVSLDQLIVTIHTSELLTVLLALYRRFEKENHALAEETSVSSSSQSRAPPDSLSKAQSSLRNFLFRTLAPPPASASASAASASVLSAQYIVA